MHPMGEKAVQDMVKIKDLQFFEDKRSLDEFMADWERRLYGRDFEYNALEIRAMRLWLDFVERGLVEEGAK